MSDPEPSAARPREPAGTLYEMLVQAVVDYAIFMLDPDGIVVSWNPGAERVKGYSADEILGRHFSCFYTDEDRAAGVPVRALETARTVGRFTAEGWRQRQDGTRFWAMVVIDRIVRDGQLVGFAKVTRDMTEQRRAQIAALDAERRFRLLVQGVTDYAIFMLDPDGMVVNWNAGAERIKGYRLDEIVGRSFSTFYAPEDVAAGVPARALEAARNAGRFEAEGWRLRKDGTRFWANVVIDAIYDEGQLIGFAKITRDLTERRQAQLELEQSREQLLQAQKMEAVGQLTGGLAHDFNNLLTGISGSLQLMQLRLAQGRAGELDRYIDAAQSAVSRAAALTHRLLAFARRQTLDPKPTDVNRLITELMEQLVGRTIGPQIETRFEAAPDLWPVCCDRNQLENSVLNLCINSRDAMPHGGGLTIETRNRSIDRTEARACGLASGDYVEIAVRDTGTGMAPDVIERAFDPFFTTKPIGAGTGLGLSMIYGFVKQSGGGVRVDSRSGQGTTMYLYLPRFRGVAGATETVETEPVAPRSPGREIVLFVDDEPTLRLLVPEALRDLGYQTIEAADAAGGLAALDTNRRVDVLITDVGLPGGMNGRQLADVARERHPNLKVLLITGYAEKTALGPRGLGPGMEILTKPFSIEALASRAREILTARGVS